MALGHFASSWPQPCPMALEFTKHHFAAISERFEILVASPLLHINTTCFLDVGLLASAFPVRSCFKQPLHWVRETLLPSHWSLNNPLGREDEISVLSFGILQTGKGNIIHTVKNSITYSDQVCWFFSCFVVVLGGGCYLLEGYIFVLLRDLFVYLFCWLWVLVGFLFFLFPIRSQP